MDKKQIRKLIASGDIKTFADLVDHTTVNGMGKIIGCSRKRIFYLKRKPEKMELGELWKLAEWLGYKWWKVAELCGMD